MSSLRTSLTVRRTLIGAALLAIGGGIGAGTALTTRPAVVMAPTVPSPVAALAKASDRDIVSVRGKVAEVYGGDFILADPTGRILVRGGRGGQDALVAAGQTVTVQGSTRDGELRPMFLIGADNRVTALRGHGGRHGPHRRDRDEQASPPPPPSLTPAAAPAPAA